MNSLKPLKSISKIRLVVVLKRTFCGQNLRLWKATKKIKRPIIQVTPLKKADGTWDRTNEEKGTMFADHLEKTFQPLPRQIEQENTLPVDSGEDWEIRYVTPKEVKNEIKSNINIRKAPGLDLITEKILKELPRKAIVKLTCLMLFSDWNMCPNSGR